MNNIFPSRMSEWYTNCTSVHAIVNKIQSKNIVTIIYECIVFFHFSLIFKFYFFLWKKCDLWMVLFDKMLITTFSFCHQVKLPNHKIYHFNCTYQWKSNNYTTQSAQFTCKRKPQKLLSAFTPFYIGIECQCEYWFFVVYHNY